MGWVETRRWALFRHPTNSSTSLSRCRKIACAPLLVHGQITSRWDRQCLPLPETVAGACIPGLQSYDVMINSWLWVMATR